ncbi:hypothetical protein PR002_g12076 [Phytophthora rubi]|uniref:RxLR effector protein n=1 Tax=Phytophthora rubi TaxID=129364 RepID=A0A6A3LV35_9STRA|nr:hypothetical protein PR002_g12076 [Phytophthora rubi]
MAKCLGFSIVTCTLSMRASCANASSCWLVLVGRCEHLHRVRQLLQAGAGERRQLRGLHARRVQVPQRTSPQSAPHWTPHGSSDLSHDRPSLYAR